MIEIQNTNKDLLAKLMATEDINVLHKNVPTAYFDVKNRKSGHVSKLSYNELLNFLNIKF